MVTTKYLALLVRQVFRGFRVSVAIHLRDGTEQLGLRRAQQNNALDVPVDEVIIVILLEDRGPRVAQYTVSFLVGKGT